MPSSRICSICSRCPFLTPFDHLSKGKKGTCKNLQQNKEKTKGYNANNASTHLPPLELMPCNAFLMYLEHFSKVPSSDPFHNQSKEKKKAPAKTCNKTKKKQKTTTKLSKQHVKTPAISRVQCLAMPSSYIWSICSGCPFLTPFDHLSKGKKGHLQKAATKQRKKRLQCKQRFNTFTISRAHALQCLLHLFGAFFHVALS